jgi:hypothetical protein
MPRLLALAMLVLAFVESRALTRDLEWPAVDIQYRETATAQTLLDEGAGRDPAYRGESLWYNPLSGWIAALASHVTGRPLREVVPRIGPFVNLVAPIGFYALVAILVDEGAALLALAAYLFVTANAFPFWFAASYSPWFAPENYGQGLLYLSLVLVAVARRRGWRLGGDIALGLALGVTFLAHTAPAIIVGTVLVLLAVLRVRDGVPVRTAAVGLGTSLAVALLASVALVWPLVGRYRLAVLNPRPSASPAHILWLQNRLALLAQLSLQTPFLVAAAVLPVSFWRRRASVEGRVLIASALAIVLLIAYGDLRSLLRRVDLVLPAFPMPTYHFLFYGFALVSVGCGIAMSGLAGLASRYLFPRGADPARRREWAAAVLAVGAVVLGWPSHARRPDATEVRETALSYAHAIPRGAFDWIRSSTASDDVFLSSDDVSLFVVSPAGRKVLCTNVFFSNPFVDWEVRNRDRERLLQHVRDNDLEAFDGLADRWGVRYVVASDGLPEFLSDKAGIDRSEHPPLATRDIEGRRGFVRVFGGEGFAIYRRSQVESASALPAR